MSLIHFSPTEIVLSDQQCWEVLVFFFGGNAAVPVTALTSNDKSFAQAMLIEAIDKSYAMSWIEAVFREAMSLTPSIRNIIGALARHAVRTWLNEIPLEEIENQQIYISVKNTLTANWRSAWRIRIETEQNVY
jgi:hypothetical protein